MFSQLIEQFCITVFGMPLSQKINLSLFQSTKVVWVSVLPPCNNVIDNIKVNFHTEGEWSRVMKFYAQESFSLILRQSVSNLVSFLKDSHFPFEKQRYQIKIKILSLAPALSGLKIWQPKSHGIKSLMLPWLPERMQ